MKPILSIDGSRFKTLDEFYDEISDRVIPGAIWGRNLDAFNDILRGGFGTPDEGFTLIWENHKLSRKRLDHGETIRQLQSWLKECHPSNILNLNAMLDVAERGDGTTVFDWIVEIILHHCPGGQEASDNVELFLI